MGKISGLKRVLILSVAVGSGHMRTAEALKQAAGVLYPGAEVRILDTFRYASPFLGKLVLGAYLEMLKKSPFLYEFLYNQARRGRPLSGKGKAGFSHIINIAAAPRLIKYINNFQPEIIVCTHAFPLGIGSYFKRKGVFQGPLLAIVTDYDVHSFYIFPEVDYYIVGAEALIPQCRAYGINPDQVYATGIPIHAQFSNRYDRAMLRQQIGLDPEPPVVLLTGGGLGMGSIATVFKTLGASKLCQLLCVTGSNNALRVKLDNMAQGMSCRAKVFGFVDNIHELMAASDLMVGKAGGLACAEAMALGLPLFIVGSLPGQEVKNAEFITAAGAGVRIDPDNLGSLVEYYLRDMARVRHLASMSALHGKPDAARDAVRLMAAVVNSLGVVKATK